MSAIATSSCLEGLHWMTPRAGVFRGGEANLTYSEKETINGLVLVKPCFGLATGR